MKNYDQIKQEAKEYFNANYTSVAYSDYEKELYAVAYCKGYFKSKEDTLKELELKDKVV